MVQTIIKEVDDISIIGVDYLKATKYGCCGDEDYNELSTIWTDYTFLKFNSNFYTVEIPNSHTYFFFGYLLNNADKDPNVIGELYFAHSLPILPKDKHIYSAEYKIANKIILKAKNEETLEKISSAIPTISLVKNTSRDNIVNYPDHQELVLWSYDKFKGLNGLNFIALKIQFDSDTIVPPVEIPIKNGYINGNTTLDQTIYLDF